MQDRLATDIERDLPPPDDDLVNFHARALAEAIIHTWLDGLHRALEHTPSIELGSNLIPTPAPGSPSLIEAIARAVEPYGLNLDQAMDIMESARETLFCHHTCIEVPSGIFLEARTADGTLRIVASKYLSGMDNAQETTASNR